MARSLRFAGWSLAMLTAVLLTSGSASAQIGGIGPSGSPLGMTSPLGIGPAPAVPRTGIPIGATELSTPGVSPMTSGTSPALRRATSQRVPALAVRFRRYRPAWEVRCQGFRPAPCQPLERPARPLSSTAAARWGTRQAPAWEPPAVRPLGRHRRPRHRQEWGWGRRSAASAYRWARPSWEWEGSAHRLMS
jgi:hypothetical protein